MTTSYVAGTVSVTAGSDIVTGVGTGWQSANIAPGYFGLDSSNGNPVPVLEILSDTQMRLVKPWRGTTASGQAYWLSYDTRDGQQTVNNAQRLAEYIARLNNPVVSALSGITPAEGTFPYFDSATTAIAAPISAFGLSLVAALNSGAAYSALGVVPNAQLPTRLREFSTVVADANTATAFGCYSVAASALNIPENGAGMLLVMPQVNGNQTAQKYIRISTRTEWTRVQFATGQWGTWIRSATLGDDGFILNVQLPNRLREISASVADANLAVTSGSYQVLSTAQNIPEAANGTLYVVGFNASAATQIYVRLSNGATYVRAQNGGVWGSWSRLPLGQTSATDATANAAMLVGAFGLGGGGILLTGTDDLNSLPRVTAIYRFSTSSVPTNAPTPSQSSILINSSFTPGASAQLVMSVNSGAMWYRSQAGEVWNSWRRVDGDVSGPGTAVTSRSIAGWAGTSGQSINQLTVSEGLSALGPVFGGLPPVPSAAGVGMSDGNFDTLTFPGVYTITGSWTNGPSGTAATGYAGVLEVQARSVGGLFVQTLRFGSNTWKRTAGSGPSWAAWTRIEAEDTAASLALSALTPAADRMPYFNGASSAALATLTAFGRSLIDDANGAAAWTTMGAGGTIDGNGWFRLPSGLIVQWGFTDAGTGNVNRSFPIAFPNAAYTVHVSTAHSEETETNAFVAWGRILSLSQFRVNGRYLINGGTIGAGGIGVCFIAFGR